MTYPHSFHTNMSTPTVSIPTVSGGDADHFKQLAEDLGQLTLDATFGVVSDSHQMNAEMKAMLEDINKKLEYKVVVMST